MVHIIIGGVVVNTIVATFSEAQHAYPDATVIDATHGTIGWLWDGSTLTAPPAPSVAPTVPDTVTMRQARLALLRAGVLATVDATIKAMPGVDGDAARIIWEYSTEVHRTDTLVTQLGPVLGLDIDALFIAAAGL